MAAAPRILVTGFGPFPGAPENPTQGLVQALAGMPAATVGAGSLRAVLLPTDYRKSWRALLRLYSRAPPDVVLHFGLSRKAEAIHAERSARRSCDRALVDCSGFAPRSGLVVRAGPDMLPATLPADAIADALQASGFSAAVSDDAGPYVCNATLYRSLHAAPAGRMVGFLHVPPEGQGGYTAAKLLSAAEVAVRTASRCWSDQREAEPAFA